MKAETQLEYTQLLVAEAEGLVARQQELVAVLENSGSRTIEALLLLGQFEIALASFRQRLAYLRSSTKDLV